MVEWEDIVNCDIEQACIDNCNQFKVICDKFPKFLKYVENTIFGLMKENVVKFWVNKVMHMGNSTTNRVESSHSRLKKYLTSSTGDLSTNWNSI